MMTSFTGYWLTRGRPHCLARCLSSSFSPLAGRPVSRALDPLTVPTRDGASVALQRQRIESVVDDWFVMADDEKKQVIQMIFAEIRADHTRDGLSVEFRARAAWEPYIEAVLATHRQAPKGLAPAVITSVARRGFEPLTSSLKGKRPGPLGDRAARAVRGYRRTP